MITPIEPVKVVGSAKMHVRLVADRHGDVVAAAGRDAAHADHDRHVAALLAQLREVVVEVVAAADRSRRAN